MSDELEEEETHLEGDHPPEEDSSAVALDLSAEGHQEEEAEAPGGNPGETKQLHRTKVMEVVEGNFKGKNPGSSQATKTKVKNFSSNGTSMSPSITM
jgi:hypothetical protein